MDMEECVGLRECNKIHDKLRTCTGMYCTQANTEVLKN